MFRYHYKNSKNRRDQAKCFFPKPINPVELFANEKITKMNSRTQNLKEQP